MVDPIDVSDNRRLIEALRQGDAAAFETVYEAYGASLRAYAARILQDSDAAFEVVQDTYMAVWANRKSLDEGKSLRNYLLRAVHNNALRSLQAKEARKAREENAMEEWVAEWTETPCSPRGSELLVPAIDRLPEQSRKVLLMSFWEEKKNAVIASELSISIRTVETILYRAVKRLRKELKPND